MEAHTGDTVVDEDSTEGQAGSQLVVCRPWLKMYPMEKEDTSRLHNRSHTERPTCI